MSRCIALLAALLLMLFALPVQADEQQNLLVNGGFDSLDADGLPSGWYIDAYYTREGITLYQTVADGRTGTAAVVENLGENDARFAQVVRVEPNTVYRLSGWIRADQIHDSGRGANLSVADLYDACSQSVFDSEGEWTYVELYGKTGPKQKELTVFARVGGYSGVSIGRACFDDLSLVKVTSAPSDAVLKKWYKEEAPAVVYTEPEDTADESAAFWPWLVVISGVYIAAGFFAMRWTQAGSEELKLKHVQDSKGLSVEKVILIAGIAVAAAVRIIVALNVEGYGVDVGCFRAWGYSVLQKGPAQFYGLGGDFALHEADGANFCDYPPAYLYVLAFGEWLSRVFGFPQYFAHKLIPMTCDLLGALLIGRVAVRQGARQRQGTVLALLFAFNPATILNSAAWCQVDSSLCFLLMLVAYLAIERRWMAVLPVYVLSVLVKPQALMLGFLGLAAIIMELVRNAPQRDKDTKRLVFPPVWKQMGLGVLISLVVALVIIVPFSLNQSDPFWLISLYGETLSSYPYATVNTTNLYYLSEGNWDSILQNADMGVKVFFVVASAVAMVYAFLRRKDRTCTWLEPVLTAAAVLGVAFVVLSVMAMASGGDYLLTTGDPWRVYVGADGNYVREFIPDLVGTSCLVIPPVLLLVLGVVLLAAAAVMTVLLVKRLSSGAQKTLHTGLIEPALMALFLLVFAVMLFFDVTWGALGVTAMAMAFAIVLPMFIRSGELAHLPLCGAVLFILLFVFGVKMHERYLFPALFLLGMAYAARRDRRILWLLIGMSCTLLINEGIILDNDLRLDNGHVNVDPDSVWLTDLNAWANVLMGLWSVWVCRRICVEGSQPRLASGEPTPLTETREYQEKPCTPFNYKPAGMVKWTRLDVILVLSVTLVYGVVTLATLGSTKAPQTAWKSTSAQEQVIIDLGQHYDDFSMLYFAQVSYNDFSVAVSEDGETWPEDQIYWGEMAEGQCFRWKYLVPRQLNGDGSYATDKYGRNMYRPATNFADVEKMDGRFVCITAQQIGLVLNEVIFRDAQGNQIPATVVGALKANEGSPLYSAPECLLDEQDTLGAAGTFQGEPGWWNSTYFDEIYHARTGFEHLNGTTPYETSHPPLGKVIMSWCIAIFGMTPFGWRFAGALCGILMLPALYALTKQLTRRTDMAFAAMTLMALDCMHFTQTRIATIDSFPVLFIILSYFFMLRFMERDIVKSPVASLLPDLALSGFFMGCGVASKWIGVYAGVGLAVLYFWTCLRQLRIGIDCARIRRSGAELTQEQRAVLEERDRPAMKRVVTLCLWCLLFFVLVPVVIYLASYIPYYAYRDIANPIEYLSLVIDSQEGMLNYHATPGLGMDHPFYSPWYEWPLNQRPMYYAMDSFMPDGWSYAIFCFGNPAVWYAGIFGVVYAFFCWIRRHRYRAAELPGTWHLYADTWRIAPAFVLIGLLAQFLPWVLVPRGTYIYHYFASVPFLILGTVLLLSRVCRPGSKTGQTILIAYLCFSLVLFVLLFPYASGMPAPNAWLEFVRGYPWVDTYLYWNENSFVEALQDVMLSIPLFPNVYH